MCVAHMWNVDARVVEREDHNSDGFKDWGDDIEIAAAQNHLSFQQHQRKETCDPLRTQHVEKRENRDA